MVHTWCVVAALALTSLRRWAGWLAPLLLTYTLITFFACHNSCIPQWFSAGAVTDCIVGETTHASGTSFMDEDSCNTCFCKDGRVKCTQLESCRIPGTVTVLLSIMCILYIFIYIDSFRVSHAK